MKIVTRNLLVATLVSVLIGTMGSYTAKASQLYKVSTQQPKTNGGTVVEQPIFQMPVLSDTHLGTDAQRIKLITALNDYKTIAPNYNAIAFVGDLTNDGTASEYDDFMNVLNQHAGPQAEKILVMGNHDYSESSKKSSLLMTDAVNKFVSKTGMPGLYYDKWVGGYHFITLSQEPLDETTKSTGFSDAQLSWLEQTLAINASSDKPVFVFLHEPLYNTVAGSELWSIRNDRLQSILNKYPQAIMFSGHTHYSLMQPRFIYQDNFTMVATGGLLSVDYGGNDGTGAWGANIPEGLLVNVYKDHVEVKARSFNTGTWINAGTIKVPFQKTIVETQSPYFDKASIKCTGTTSNSATISFTSAKGNSLIERYDIVSGSTVLQKYYTRFWESPLKTTTITIKNLAPGTAYDLKVVAVDAWGNTTLSPLSIQVKTN